MPEEKDQWIDVIAKLIKLTQEEKIKWSSSAPPENLSGEKDRYVETTFLAEYKGKKLRLYQRHLKVEEPPPFVFVAVSSGIKFPYWTSRIMLEIVDSSGRPLWEFPQVGPLNDLLTSVKYQVSGVKDFIDKLLSE